MKHTVTTASAIADRFLASGDAVLEIGAACGEFTRVYADRVGPTGFVLAVEPHRESYRALLKAYRDYSWVTALPVAVGSGEGDEVFLASQTVPNTSSFWAKNVIDPSESYEVVVTTVDALVRSMPCAPRVIQVDAQGAEAAILRGATKTLALPIVWVIEVWATGLLRAGAEVRDICALFQAYAYTPYSLLGKRLDWDTAHAYAAGRARNAHADFMMVPDAMEAAW